MESTTLKVSEDTAKKLAVLQRRLRKESLDDGEVVGTRGDS
jgi:hypothetical protein